MTLALVMDDHDLSRAYNSKQLVDWCMYGEGQMAFILNNGLFRDGGGMESPSYNAIRFDFINASQRFEQLRALRPEHYPEGAYPDIFAQPKARALFDHFLDLTVQGRFTPSIAAWTISGVMPRGRGAMPSVSGSSATLVMLAPVWAAPMRRRPAIPSRPMTARRCWRRPGSPRRPSLSGPGRSMATASPSCHPARGTACARCM